MSRPKSYEKENKMARIEKRDGTGCYYCGTYQPLTLDHIVPRALGGTWEVENLRIACLPCNQQRGRDFNERGVIEY